MWVATDEGRLVNLDHVEHIGIDKGVLCAVVAGGTRSFRLIKATKAQPIEYLRALASILATDARHTDMTNLG